MEKYFLKFFKAEKPVFLIDKIIYGIRKMSINTIINTYNGKMNIESYREDDDNSYSRFANPFFEGEDTFDIEEILSVKLKYVYSLGIKNILEYLFLIFVCNILIYGVIVDENLKIGILGISIIVTSIVIVLLDILLPSSHIKFNALEIKFNNGNRVCIPVDNGNHIVQENINKLINDLIKINPKININNRWMKYYDWEGNGYLERIVYSKLSKSEIKKVLNKGERHYIIEDLENNWYYLDEYHLWKKK